jgi:hypothetical protein
MVSSRTSTTAASTDCLDATAIGGYVAGTTRDVAAIVHHVETCETCRRRVVDAVHERRPQPVTSVEEWLAAHRSVRPLRAARNRRRR